MQRSTLTRLQLFAGASTFLLIVISGLLLSGKRPTESVRHASAPGNVATQSVQDSSDLITNDDGLFDLPLPFDNPASSMKGSLVQIGQRLYKVKFPAGTNTETLVENKIYLVYVENDATIDTVPFDITMSIPGVAGHEVDYYGYKYTSLSGAQERSLAGTNQSLRARFPGEFFASAKALANDPQHGYALMNFAMQNAIQWRPTGNAADAVKMTSNSLYIVIVNDPSADMTVRGVTAWCGNGVVNAPAEECDDQNTADNDGCTNTCTVQEDYVCSGNPSHCVQTLAQGTLFVTQSSTPVRSHQLLGGTLSDEVMRLTFAAQQEDIAVTHLNLTVQNNGESIDRLELFAVGETTPFAIATMGTCGLQSIPAGAQRTFCAVMNTDQFVVAKDSQKHILVRADMKTDTDGAISSPSAVNITVEVGSPLRPVRAIGKTSNGELAKNNNDDELQAEVIVGRSTAGADATIIGTTMHVVLSKLESLIDVNMDPTGMEVPRGVFDAASFRLTAAPNNNAKNGQNKVQLQDISFNVLAQNIAFSSPKLYNILDTSTKFDCQLSHPMEGNMFIVQCLGIDQSDLNASLDPGAVMELALELDVINNLVTASLPSRLQVSLSNYSNPQAWFTPNMGNDYSHVRWADKDAASSTSFAWFDVPETTIRSTLYGPSLPVCGNGLIQENEQCDDGNQDETDDCDNQCRLIVPLPFNP